MATTSPSSALVATAPVFTDTERLALAEFLAGYSGVSGRPGRRESRSSEWNPGGL